MKAQRNIPRWLLTLALALPFFPSAQAGTSETGGSASPGAVLRIEEGYVDVSGVLIYYKTFGTGPPLMILHGGPGASHDYFLPHLLPLARKNRLVFIDERGSGKSGKLEDPKLYTVANMVDDAE